MCVSDPTALTSLSLSPLLSSPLLSPSLQGEDEEMEGSSESSSPKRSHGDEEDVDVPKVEMEEDIPLAKAGYSVPQPYPPIQVNASHCLTFHQYSV